MRGPGGAGGRTEARKPKLRVVAFGGGHGLSASLRALRRCQRELDLDITAVVTVGDDGGSSGRLRNERDAQLPPGDLRQALAALADDDPGSQRTAALLQHRFATVGDPDPLAGHAVGNLLLLGLMELLGDPVEALDHAGAMVGAHGRVLPMSCYKIGIEADVRGGDPARPGDTVTVRGQHQVAITTGHVEAVRLV
ncbi:MAG TPA: 2-phospho-L-lactate transferase CofD family protein, partial [Actinoplanes sp.]|nr:2-phospho-L-lactate transferase CofD family protein [Actinoplanes sp.]